MYNSVLTGNAAARVVLGRVVWPHIGVCCLGAGVCDEPMGDADMASFDALTSYMTRCMGRGLAVSAAIAMHNIPGTCLATA